MKALTKGMGVALLHLVIVLSLGGKFLYDRAHRPRVWVRTGQVDPNLPIRGRYIALQVQVEAPWFKPTKGYAREDVRISVENGKLVAKADSSTGLSISHWDWQRNREEIFLDQGLAFFIPEHAEIPRTKQGEELWAEVTIPRKGPPRPIQLALKRGAEWHPLDVR